jgi:AbrB family looped-hinge helix DNA binding protein
MIDGMEARVGTRGRVTIPVELRRRLGIKPGTRLILREEEGRIVVMTMASYVRSLKGVLKGKGMTERLREAPGAPPEACGIFDRRRQATDTSRDGARRSCK